MNDRSDLTITYCPCPDQPSAKHLAQQILEQHLAACVQIIPGIESLYWWQDQIETSTEVSLLIKSTAKHNDAICAYLEQHHPYDCPCVLQQRIDSTNQNYQRWLEQNC